MPELTVADPGVAAATMVQHLDRWVAGGRPAALGIELQRINELQWIASFKAERADGVASDRYHVLVDATHYDLHPPVLRFVVPPGEANPDGWGWPEAAPGSPWWPAFATRPGWFKLHANFEYEDGQRRQLLCFSMNADYYRTRHRPQPHQAWEQGRHTVAASLTRLGEVLSPPYYASPSRHPA